MLPLILVGYFTFGVVQAVMVYRWLDRYEPYRKTSLVIMCVLIIGVWPVFWAIVGMIAGYMILEHLL